jgi:glucan phosphoethanolaminetransferase (alkaline phosphatase superfamily)
MLQRIQSIWLLLAAVCAFLTVKFSFYSGNLETPGQPVSFQYLTASFSIWIFIVTIALVCIAAIDIFLYKNRKLQGRLAILGIILSLLNIYLYLNAIHRFIEHQGSHTISSVFVFVLPILFFLAFRGIYRDQKLVKSLDRLR